MVPKDGDKKVFFDIVVGTEQPVRFRRLDLSKKTAREAFDKWYNDPKNRVKLSECASEFEFCRLIFEAGATAFDV